MLVANATRPGLHGVSVRVAGSRLGLQISKPDDKHGDVNGGIEIRKECIIEINVNFVLTASSSYRI